MTDIHRGDVVLVSFPFVAGGDAARKRRPALIVQSDRYNSRRAAVILVAITSSRMHRELPSKVAVGKDTPEGRQAGLRLDSAPLGPHRNWHTRHPGSGCRTSGFRPEPARIACKSLFAALFVMGPHPNDLDSPDPLEDLIHEPVLDVDSTGTGARQIAHQSLERRRRLVGIPRQDGQQPLGLWLEVG